MELWALPRHAWALRCHTSSAHMAFHKHFKLPPYKLTQRCVAATQVRSIHRGDSAQYDSPVQSTSVTEERETCSEPSQRIPSFPCRDGHEFSLCNEQEPLSSPEEPTLHELQSKAPVKGWSKLRMGMLLIPPRAQDSYILCLLIGSPGFLCSPTYRESRVPVFPYL